MDSAFMQKQSNETSCILYFKRAYTTGSSMGDSD